MVIALERAVQLAVLGLPFPASTSRSDIHQECLLFGVLLKRRCLPKVTGLGRCTEEREKGMFTRRESGAWLTPGAPPAFTCSSTCANVTCSEGSLPRVFSGDNVHSLFPQIDVLLLIFRGWLLPNPSGGRRLEGNRAGWPFGCCLGFCAGSGSSVSSRLWPFSRSEGDAGGKRLADLLIARVACGLAAPLRTLRSAPVERQLWV